MGWGQAGQGVWSLGQSSGKSLNWKGLSTSWFWRFRDPSGGQGLTGLQEGGMGTGDPGAGLTLSPDCSSPLPSRPACRPADSASPLRGLKAS